MVHTGVSDAPMVRFGYTLQAQQRASPTQRRRTPKVTARKYLANYQVKTSRRLVVRQLITSRRHVFSQLITSRRRIVSQLITSRRLSQPIKN